MAFYNISSTDHGLFTHELEICSFDTWGQDLCRIVCSLSVPQVARVETGAFPCPNSCNCVEKIDGTPPSLLQNPFSIVFEMKTLPFQSRRSVWTRE